MKKNRLFSILLLSGVLSLSSCTLLNDDDLKYENEYHPSDGAPEEEPDDPSAPHVGDVCGRVIDEVADAYCFKNIDYSTDGMIVNSYKEGGIGGITINNGEDYDPLLTGYRYDLYVPNSAPRLTDHKVILFIHGGAWVTGLKTDVNNYVYDFANRGYVTATIKYSLLKRTMDDSSLSIFRNLDEIDACIKSIKEALEELDFDTTKTKLVIGGASSGSHLAMLYAYSRWQNCALPLSFIVDAVGPVDIKPECWKSFNDPSEEARSDLSYAAIQTQVLADNLGDLHISGETGENSNWNDYQTMRIANGMCGLPHSLEEVEATTTDKKNISSPNEASTLMTKAGGGEDLLSVSYWIGKGEVQIPIVGAYAGQDTVVGINQAATLDKVCMDNYVEHTFYYFPNSGHTDITPEADETKYNAFINNIVDWLENK